MNEFLKSLINLLEVLLFAALLPALFALIYKVVTTIYTHTPLYKRKCLKEEKRIKRQQSKYIARYNALLTTLVEVHCPYCGENIIKVAKDTTCSLFYICRCCGRSFSISKIPEVPEKKIDEIEKLLDGVLNVKYSYKFYLNMPLSSAEKDKIIKCILKHDYSAFLKIKKKYIKTVNLPTEICVYLDDEPIYIPLINIISTDFAEKIFKLINHVECE